jgi:hypothetical protein
MSAYFTNSLTPPTRLAPTSVVLAAGPFSIGQRAARSLPERWPDLPFVGAALSIYGFKAINARTRKGQPRRCPFQIETQWIGASCWPGYWNRSIRFLRAQCDSPRPRGPLEEQQRVHHLTFHRKVFHSQKHSLSANAVGQVGGHPFYAPHATIRSYLRIKSKRHSTTTFARCDVRHTPLCRCRLMHTNPTKT